MASPAQGPGINEAAPRAFLCHSSKDKPLAVRLTDDLRGAGVNVWLDKYEIKPGDSLRRKIFEEGIEQADFFLALLTPTSLHSNWVREELDAAMVKKIEGESTLIPIISDLAATDIPLSLRTVLHVALDDYGNALRQLVDACHRRLSKPPLGPIPCRATTGALRDLQLSPHAEKLAVLLNGKAQYALIGERLLSPPDILAEIPDLTERDLELAAEELKARRWVKAPVTNRPGPFSFIEAMPILFLQTDRFLREWDPADDALALASAMVNAGVPFPRSVELDATLSWGPRRFNPAAYYLVDNGHATATPTSSSRPYAYGVLQVTPRTHLFARGTLTS